MKATELMIRDWISYHNTNIEMVQLSDNEFTRKKQESFENKHVVGITDDGKVCLRWWNIENQKYSYYYIEESKIEPIPLTEDMLEANGFEYRHNDYGYDFYVYNKECPIDEIIIFKRFNAFDLVVKGKKLNMNVVNIIFVHEFQHIIRLCCMSELAYNFKIKGYG